MEIEDLLKEIKSLTRQICILNKSGVNTHHLVGLQDYLANSFIKLHKEVSISSFELQDIFHLDKKF